MSFLKASLSCLREMLPRGDSYILSLTPRSSFDHNQQNNLSHDVSRACGVAPSSIASFPSNSRPWTILARLHSDFWAGARLTNQAFFGDFFGSAFEASRICLEIIVLLGPVSVSPPADAFREQLMDWANHIATALKRSYLFRVATFVPRKVATRFRLAILPVWLEPYKDETGNLNDEGHYKRLLWRELFKIFYAVVVGPTWEELIFRGPMALAHYMLPVTDGTMGNEATMRQLISFNNFMFAMTHFPKKAPHLRTLHPNTKGSKTDMAFALFSMVFGAVSHYRGSAEHNRTLVKYSLAATIGSHATWNFNLVLLNQIIATDLRAAAAYVFWRLGVINQAANYCELAIKNGDPTVSKSRRVYTFVKAHVWARMATFLGTYGKVNWKY